MQELLVGLVAGDLSPAQEEFVRLHLAGCPRCQERYAGLKRTRAALAALHADYRPQLTGRIAKAIARERGGLALRRWGGLVARVGGVAAVLLFLLVAVLQGPAPRPARAVAEPVYVLQDRFLLQVDLASRATRQMAELDSVGGRIFEGGLLDLSWDLYEITPSGEPVHLLEDRDSHIDNADAVMRRGSALWLARNYMRPGQEQAFDGFVLDRLDLTTGQIDPDPAPKEGTVLKGILSPDGRYAYLLAKIDTGTYVKMVDTETRSLLTAHRLPSGFDALSQLLLTSDGATLYVRGLGRLTAIDLARGNISLDLADESLTASMTMNPKGDRLLIATSQGGLAVRDAKTGQVLRQSAATPRYDAIEWREDWIYGRHYEGIDLIDPVTLKVVSTVELTVFGGWYIP